MHRSTLGRAVAIVAAPALLLAGGIPAAHAATSTTSTASAAQTRTSAQDNRIIQLPVAFTVRNVNRSRISCPADGRTYTVRGHITGPRDQLLHPSSVTLLLHGLSYGEFFSNYTAQPGYDFALKQAAVGHTTVTVDRLGYGRSDKPDGNNICFGSRADIAHQMVLDLRSGHYRIADRVVTAGRQATRSSSSGANGPAFRRVALAGHSVGSIIAQAEAYSFGDIDGLILLSYSDTTVSPAAKMALKTAVAQCKAGGQRSNGTTGAPNYVYFGASTPYQFVKAHFSTPHAARSVWTTTAALRNRDPCGDVMSYMGAVAADMNNLQLIRVPVLVMIGGKDAIYPIVAGRQAGLLTHAASLTAVTVPNTGHALTLHYTHYSVSASISRWLDSHGERAPGY